MAALKRIFTTDHPYFRRVLARVSKTASVKYYIGIALLIGTIYNINDLSTTSTRKSLKSSNVLNSNIDHFKTAQITKKPKTINSPIDLPERFQLPDSINNSLYFTPRENGKIGCYTDGSVHPEPGMKWPCKCRPGFYGPACSIPEVVLTSACHQNPESCLSLKVRSKPRRIIRFLNVHREVDLVEIQLGDHSDLVDVFVIGESERTISGDPNELFFLPKMKDEGLFKEYQHKIIHVIIPATDFPDDVVKNGNGYISEGFIRNYMGEKGLTRIDGIEDDDLVLLSDTNKFINRDILMFLKIHDGFPEPVRVNFLELEYGFFWRRKFMESGSKYQHFQGAIDPVACTIGMLREVYDNHLMLLRRESFDHEGRTKEDESLRKLIAKRKVEYSRGGKHNVSDNWAIGRLDSIIGGFHCSWCFQPEGIREYWVATKKLNLPDWGPNKEKLNLDYIEEAIAKGNLFGLSERNLYLENPEFEGDLNFAPEYVWKNQDKFGYLLYPDGGILESI